ncbi:hypothetical protein [Caballeronia sp. LZ032]|uniref:hypothetical protein n=1 Tax=Caballeronia sp. LZ032 TaxID=3038565 RepID=UPI0028662970|nr:hypothetical protein [Caballeronia sp. LZ032]MDR5877312.1 hypothetical protein [Caballeronia sp. LZ032]
MKVSLRRLLVQIAIIAAGAVTLSGAYAAAVIIAPSAPPAPRYERIPPPRAGFIWEAGHWVWQGRYVWAAGRWVEVRAGRRWIAGVWSPYRGQYRYVPGHWI